MKYIFIKIIDFYQKILSPLKRTKTCIFYPTCSEYSKQAFIKYGVIKGILLSSKRIIRCNPFNKGGYDPLK